MKPICVTKLLALSACGLALAVCADDLPVLTTGHNDVGVNYEDGAWDLHVHAEDLGMEYEPGGVWLKVGGSARTTVPSAPEFSFLGTAGGTIWILPAIQKPDLLFLGLGTEEIASGIFSNDTVRLALTSVDGPGDFIAYQLDAFGTPGVFFNSRDGLGASDFRTLTAGGHTHVNWAFTAPGRYRIGLQASGVLTTNHETTTSEVVTYLFDVGELPRLTLAAAAGDNNVHLQWLSETNASYQIQYRLNDNSGAWTNLGSPIAGTGSVIQRSAENNQAAQFFRLAVDYNR
jgi:surface-anchored protein